MNLMSKANRTAIIFQVDQDAEFNAGKWCIRKYNAGKVESAIIWDSYEKALKSAAKSGHRIISHAA